MGGDPRSELRNQLDRERAALRDAIDGSASSSGRVRKLAQGFPNEAGASTLSMSRGSSKLSGGGAFHPTSSLASTITLASSGVGGRSPDFRQETEQSMLLASYRAKKDADELVTLRKENAILRKK